MHNLDAHVGAGLHALKRTGVDSDPTEIPLLRVPLDPNDSNGLDVPSSIMLDKVTTMPRSRLAERLGKVSDADMRTLSRGLLVFLGFA